MSDELRGELLKKPDLTLQTAHDYCRTFEAAELQKYKFNTPTVAGSERSLHPLRKVKVQEKTPVRNCKFCGYKHPFTQPPRCPALGKKCNKCKNEGHFAQVCKELSAEGSQLAAVEHEPPMNHDVHTFFGSVELDSISGTRKKSRSLIAVKIAGKELYKEITNKPLQKLQQPLNWWLAPKPIHPKCSVRLPTRYGSR